MADNDSIEQPHFVNGDPIGNGLTAIAHDVRLNMKGRDRTGDNTNSKQTLKEILDLNKPEEPGWAGWASKQISSLFNSKAKGPNPEEVYAQRRQVVADFRHTVMEHDSNPKHPPVDANAVERFKTLVKTHPDAAPEWEQSILRKIDDNPSQYGLGSGIAQIETAAKNTAAFKPS